MLNTHITLITLQLYGMSIINQLNRVSLIHFKHPIVIRVRYFHEKHDSIAFVKIVNLKLKRT